jgi:hypothetical protein
VQGLNNTATTDHGFAAAFPSRHSRTSLSQKWRKLQAAIVAALTMPTWWEYL